MPDLFRLKGRVALLTGAAGHLGAGMAEALCEAGARVALNGRDAAKLEKLRVSLRRRGFAAESFPEDVSRAGGAAKLVVSVRRKLRRLDILVNNAYAGKAGTLETASAADFRETSEVALIAPFSLIQAALPHLRRGASIVNVASMYGIVSPDPSVYKNTGLNNPPFYGAAKAGLLQLTRYAACHLAPKGIRVNSLVPGPFPAPAVARAHPAFVKALSRKVPLGRVGRPEELKGPLVFLASDASSFMTGATLVVDGGWTAW
jgi:NAD(P)-dependent dehydrogenase (short-subunit alcohol dehydrogenase family)